MNAGEPPRALWVSGPTTFYLPPYNSCPGQTFSLRPCAMSRGGGAGVGGADGSGREEGRATGGTHLLKTLGCPVERGQVWSMRRTAGWGWLGTGSHMELEGESDPSKGTLDISVFRDLIILQRNAGVQNGEFNVC